MSYFKELDEACKDLRFAFEELFWAIIYELKIDRLIEWLENKLRKK